MSRFFEFLVLVCLRSAFALSRFYLKHSLLSWPFLYLSDMQIKHAIYTFCLIQQKSILLKANDMQTRETKQNDYLFVERQIPDMKYDQAKIINQMKGSFHQQ